MMNDFLRTLVEYSLCIINDVLFMAQFFAASLFFASTTLINISFIDGRTLLKEITVPDAVIDLMISFVLSVTAVLMRTVLRPFANEELKTE